MKTYHFEGTPSKEEIAELIWTAVDMGCSDLSIDTGYPAYASVNGVRHPLTNALSGPQAKAISLHLVDYNQAIFNRTEKALEYYYAHQAKCPTDATQTRRFRVAGLSSTVVHSNSSCSATARLLAKKPLLPEEINLPDELVELVKDTDQGIIMFVGGTGQGKSTSLAAIIRKLLETEGLHKKIMSFEDPIEVMYDEVIKAIGNTISQHEIGDAIYGTDLITFEAALRVSLRSVPDILVLGEMRDASTMRPAVAFSNSGHLLLTTLHANNAAAAYARLFNAFPADERDAAMFDMLTETKAVIAQSLERTIDGGLVALREIVYNNSELRDRLINVQTTMDIRRVINEELKRTGLSFAAHAQRLAEEGVIDLETLAKYQ